MIDSRTANRYRWLASVCVLATLFSAGCWVRSEMQTTSTTTQSGNGSAPSANGVAATSADGSPSNADEAAPAGGGSAETKGEQPSGGDSTHLVSAVMASNFDEKVLAQNQVVLVDFWAPWCGPCRSQAPILEKLANEMQDRARIVKLNVDEPGNSQLAQKHGITAIPTLLLFKNGKVIGRFVGLQNKETLTAAINKFSKS